MGRAKLKMEFIMKEKSRHLTFKKRKEGLIKKIKEFTTLCDVSACMIIYGPEDSPTGPLIWPENLYEVERIITIYKTKKKDCENRGVGLADFVKDKSKKIAEEVSKLQATSMEATNYLTSIDILNEMSETNLREFASVLITKLDNVYSKIEMLKLNVNGYLVQMPETTGLFHFTNGRILQPYANNINNNKDNTSYLVQRGIELDLTNSYHQPVFSLNHFETMQENQQTLTNSNSNSMRMMLKNNENDYMQFGGLSNNMHCSSYAYPIYYEQAPSSSSTSSSYDVNNLLQEDYAYLSRYFSPMVQQPMPPYMQCVANIMPSLPPPLNSLQDNHGGDFDYQYQVKNSKAKF